MVTDSFGRKIDFRNTIIILTSNAGASSIKRQSSLGFGAMQEDEADFDGMKEKILEEAKRVAAKAKYAALSAAAGTIGSMPSELASAGAGSR